MPDGQVCPVPRQLDLRSRLEDLSLVFPWVGGLAAEYAIPSGTIFAINLCLEEVLSNIVRHGHRGDGTQRITVRFELGAEGELFFIVEDSAPHFDQTALREESAPLPLEEIAPGGNGLRLLGKFAGSLAWTPLDHGNRLRIGFQVPRIHQEK